MHDRELELIAALVEGRLDDEAEARALIASGPEYHEEYETQKLAFEALRDAGTVSLSEIERSALHRDVWTSLRTESAVAAKTPWYYRWVPVAAGMFVIVGIVAVVSQDDPETVNLAADLPVTTTADESLDRGAGSDDSGSEQEPDQSLAPTEGGESTDGATDTTEAASEETVQDAAAVYAEEADQVRQGVLGGSMRSYSATSADAETDESCVEQAGLVDHQILATLTAPDDGHSIAVAHPDDETVETAPIAFVDLETCEVEYLDE